MGRPGFFSPPDFVEREPWERGFAQTFARDIAPRLAALELRRWLSIALIALFVIAAVLLIGVGSLFGLFGALILGLFFPVVIEIGFRQQEEKLVLPAVCRQFEGLTVLVAPARRNAERKPYWDALLPYWDLNLIAKPRANQKPALDVREVFTAQRGNVALSVVAIYLRAKFKRVFYGDLVKLTLPELAPGSQYAAGRFEVSHPGDADLSAGSHDLRTPRVAGALFEFWGVCGAPLALGAVFGNQLYLAMPFAKKARRIARLGLWRRVYHCESAIRFALAQLNAVLNLADAVAEACAHPAPPPARAAGAVAVAVAAPVLPRTVWVPSPLVIGFAVGVVLALLAWVLGEQ